MLLSKVLNGIADKFMIKSPSELGSDVLGYIYIHGFDLKHH